MYQVLFSVYYPHARKCQLAKYGVLPLFDTFREESFNYFFSLYKGESITIRISCSEKDDIKRQIVEHFKTFFTSHSAEVLEVQLPLKKLFLDFPFNTLHFWEYDPFKSETLNSGNSKEDNYMTFLSRQCLSKLVSENRWDDASSFQVFIELFSVLKVLLEQKFGNEAILVFTELIEELKKRSGEQSYIIDKFANQGKGIYKQNQSDIEAYFHATKVQIEGSSQLQESWVTDWMGIIYQQLMTNATDFNQVYKVSRELILDVSSKIDLKQKGLVQVLALVSEMMRRGEN